MSTEVKVPNIGDFAEVEVIELMVKVGDTVKVDQSLITVESDKASMEVPSSHAGVVKEVKVKVGDKVAMGTIVFVVEATGGLVDGMPYMTGTGGEKLPEGVDPKSVMVERSVPKDAMADALLAWEMNGEPLSLAHGGPLRLVVPGYQGVNNIKYVKRLAFTPTQSQARIMQHGYRMTPPGAKASPDQPSVWEMTVKSWINGPLPEQGPLKPGMVQVHGVAFGGTRGIKGVEVSVDGGKTWQAAQLIGPDLGRFAWRQFVLPVRLGAGTHVLASRATDTAGNVQPEQREENLSGYNNNSWRDHAVTITVA